MYKTFKALLTIFWLLDIFNVTGMEMFDTTYPINALIWFLIWLCIPSSSVLYHKELDKK